MVNGVVDIPLNGDAVLPDAAPGGGHFFAGPENCLAQVAVRSVLEQPAEGYNPLVFYGPSGTGKSHLAQGLARAWKSQARSSARSKGDSPIFAETKTGTVPCRGAPAGRARRIMCNMPLRSCVHLRSRALTQVAA